MPDRFTIETARWEQEREEVARAATRVVTDSVAERLLVGGTWITGPFRPVDLYVADAPLQWLSEDGTVVLDSNVQARTLGGRSGEDWDAYQERQPARDCRNSLQLVTGSDHKFHDGGVSTDHTPGSKFYCHECDHEVVLVAAGPGLRLRNHDTKGRPLPWPDEVDSNQCAGSGEDIPDGELCSDIPGTAWCTTCDHVAPYEANGELQGQLGRHDTYGRSLT